MNTRKVLLSGCQQERVFLPCLRGADGNVSVLYRECLPRIVPLWASQILGPFPLELQRRSLRADQGLHPLFCFPTRSMLPPARRIAIFHRVELGESPSEVCQVSVHRSTLHILFSTIFSKPSDLLGFFRPIFRRAPLVQ